MSVHSRIPRVSKKTIAKVRKSWMTIAFILGFVADNITLNRVDQVFDNLVLFTYVVLAMVSMALLYAATVGKLEGRFGELAHQYAPFLVQFSFGGLLSGMLIFYGRSGAWAESWPFLLMILVAIYGNETVHGRASRLLYNLAIMFVGLFSWVVLVIPVLTGKMGAGVFIFSGLVALFIMYWFIKLLYRIIPNYLDMQIKSVVFILGSIFVGFNFLYFANIIPPIPLSLKDVGVYHSVVRFENGDYQLKYEDGQWWQPFKNSDNTFHARPGDNVFCFAKVFAPTKFATDIYHTWEYQDPNGEWIKHAHLSYNIAGGRGSGFRGYTLIENFTDGEWRCSVETGRGQVLGRENFTIDSQSEPDELVTRVD